MNHRSHSCFQAGRSRLRRRQKQPPQLIQQDARFKGLQQEIRRAQLRDLRQHPLRNKRGNENRHRRVTLLLQLAQDADAIHTGEHHIHHQQVRPVFRCLFQSLAPIPCQLYGKFPTLFQFLPHQCAEFFTGVNQQNFLALFHNTLPFFSFCDNFPMFQSRFI